MDLQQNTSEEFRVVEDCSWPMPRRIVRSSLTSTINATNCLRAGRSRQATGGGFRLPAFALMDDGYLFLKDGEVFSESD